VIDLEATEVPAGTGAAGAAEPPQPAPNPDNPASPAPPEATAESPQPPSEPPEAAQKEPSAAAPESPAANGRRSAWLPALAGAAGGVAAFALLWFGSALLGVRDLGYAPADLDARLADVE
jgi:hypothetical protein